MFKFAHLADVHLDHSQFHGAAREERRQDYADAWLKACMATVNLGCEFMVIAGDLFDSQDASIWARSVAREGLSLLRGEGVDVFAIPGNHDRPTARDGLSLMDELADQHLLHYDGRSIFRVKRMSDGSVIRICSLPWSGAASHQLIADLENPAPDKDFFHLLIAHIGIDNLMPIISPETVPLSIFQELSWLNYVALGHVHIPYYDGLVNMPGPLVCCSRSDRLGGLQIIKVKENKVVDRGTVDIANRPYFVDDVEGVAQAESLLSQRHDFMGKKAIVSLKWTREPPNNALLEKWKNHYLHIQFIDGTEDVAEQEEGVGFTADNIEAEVLAEALGENAGLASLIIQAALDNNFVQVAGLLGVGQ